MRDEDLLGSEFDLEEEGRSETTDDDRDPAAPGGDESDDETDGNRPDAYSESLGSDDEDRGFRRAGQDDEDEDDEEDWDADDERSEDEDLRAGRHPDRDWQSIARQERRLRLKRERQLDEFLDKVIGGAGPAGAPRAEAPPSVPDEPPVKLEEIATALSEGRAEEAAAKLRQYDEWRDRKTEERLTRQTSRQRQMEDLERYMSRGLDFEGNRPFAEAVRAKAAEIKRLAPFLSQDQINMGAAALVGAEGFKRARRDPKDADLREQSRRREDSRRQVRRGPTGRAPEETGGGRVQMSKEMMSGLSRFGMIDGSNGSTPWRDLAKTPEGRKLLERRKKRLAARMKEAKAEANRGGR